jgi:uncharacterized protein YdeI (YjbR/CyaY-like superfamily)
VGTGVIREAAASSSVEQLSRLSSTVTSYIAEAIAVEEAGLEVPEKTVEDYEVPPEFAKRLRDDETYREAFEALTPGRQKGYLLHFSGASGRARGNEGSKSAERRSWRGRASMSGEVPLAL